MAGTPTLTCPECGRVARSERKLFKTRRRHRAAALALLLSAGGYAVASVPRYRQRGVLGVVPSWALIVAAPTRAPAGVADPLFLPPPPVPRWRSATGTPLGPFAVPLAGAPSKSLAEGVLDETWRRIRAGEMAAWQSQNYLARWFARNPPSPRDMGNLVVAMARPSPTGPLQVCIANRYDGLLGIDVRLPGRAWTTAVEQGNTLQHSHLLPLEGPVTNLADLTLELRLRAGGRTVYSATVLDSKPLPAGDYPSQPF